MSLITLLAMTVVSCFVIAYCIRYFRKSCRMKLPFRRSAVENTIVFGFFHPYCNAGGGGERVLWVAIRAIQKRFPNARCVVYSGDLNAEVRRENILSLAAQRFNIVLPKQGTDFLEFIPLTRRHWLEAEKYPRFTMLGQSLGSMLVGFEALYKFIPDIYIDTMGYAFTLPIFKYIGGCQVGCYVHYPTISTDMLDRVTKRTSTYNNAAWISRSPTLSYGKLLYYKLFAFLYGMAGRTSDVSMVNSTWTQGHITSLWKRPALVCYPPCNTVEFLELPLTEKSATQIILSVSQFRPEKDHELQIQAFSEFLRKYVSVTDRTSYKLVLIGSCRNAEDTKRVEKLKKLCEEMDVADLVEFSININFTDLKRRISEATIGLHTMWNEHFGIGVVELMAGGTIVLAHNSGGPKLDIVCECDSQSTGFLADDVSSYAKSMHDIFSMSRDERTRMQLAARKATLRFSDQHFEDCFIDSIHNFNGLQ